MFKFLQVCVNVFDDKKKEKKEEKRLWFL